MKDLDTLQSRRELISLLGRVGVGFTLLPACTDVIVQMPENSVGTDQGMNGPAGPGNPGGNNGGNPGAPANPREELGVLEQVAAWEEPGVLTPVSPGAWGEKIVGHYPIAISDGPRVDVFVPHPMEEDHYIEAIYLKNSVGELVAYQELDLFNSAAFASFFVDETDGLIAYAVCNLHQAWSAPLVRSQAYPGPWADKVNGHTPRLQLDGDQATVVVPHPMEEDHYIVGIYISDQDGRVIDKVQLSPGDDARHSFTLPPDVTTVTAWALCDDHDLWVGQPLSRDFAERIAAWESRPVLTADEPGAWGEKIAGHYPIALIEGSTVRVTVHHPMNADHYIEGIYLRDESGYLLDYRELSPGDSPTATFELLKADVECYVYAVCNLHENWMAPVVRSGARPGPWADKIEGHTPVASLVGQQVSVTLPHPMDAEHRIIAIYLLDQDEQLIDKIQLPLDSLEARADFALTPSTRAVTPVAICDDHDAWIGSTLPL